MSTNRKRKSLFAYQPIEGCRVQTGRRRLNLIRSQACPEVGEIVLADLAALHRDELVVEFLVDVVGRTRDMASGRVLQTVMDLRRLHLRRVDEDQG